MDLFWTVGLYLMFFVLIYMCYGRFASTVLRWSRKPRRIKGSQKIRQPKLTTGELILCYVPLYQVCVVRKALYRRNTGSVVVSILSAILIILRLINTFLLPINGYVMFATSIGIYIGVILHILLYSIVTADCAKMYSFSVFGIILAFLFPYWYCWYMANVIPLKMRAMYKEEVFNENSGDTVIKRRADK